MRFTRFILLAALVALVAVPVALAIRFTDESYLTPVGEVGKFYTHTFEVSPGGGCGPPYKYTVLSGQIPPGTTLNEDTGTVSGTPTVAGSFFFYLEGRDIPTAVCVNPGDEIPKVSKTERDFTINIVPGLSVQQNSLNPTFVNEPFSIQLTASGGGTQTWSVQSGVLAPGLTLSPSGLLSGTPTTLGDFQFVVRVSDGSRSDTETLVLRVVQRLAASTPAGPLSEVGIPFSKTVTATGGRAPYTWALTSGVLPQGLAFDPATGVITGTPAVAGSSTALLTVTDSLGLTAQVNVAITVAAKLAIKTKKLKAAKEGKRFSSRIQTTGGAGTKRFNLRGKLPKGLRFSAGAGLISGIPKQDGRFKIKVEVADSLGARASQVLLLHVKASS